MAKKTKTKTETSKPPVEAGSYSLSINPDEMFSIIQILAFSKDIFEQMAMNAHKEGDAKTSEVYAARSHLSMVLYEKFRDVANIGEPSSREIH